MRVDANGLAGAADLAVLGEVAYTAGHLDVTIEAWERVYALRVDADDKERRQVPRFASRCTCSSIPR